MSDAARALALLVALSVVSGIGAATYRAHVRAKAAQAAFSRAERGEAIFASECATCHGVGGDGAGGAPALDDGRVLDTYPTEAALTRFIESNMPASAPGTLSKEQARDAATYIQWLNASRLYPGQG